MTRGYRFCMMNYCVEEKASLRRELLSRREEIGSDRRQEAKEALLSRLLPCLSPFTQVVSFFSLPLEIDLSAINAFLAKEGRLCLPRVEEQALCFYQVLSLEEDLTAGPWGLREPNPMRCQMACIDKRTCVLVPGIGFSRSLHRMGYGKGHYDRWIAEKRKGEGAPYFLGVGFKEQWVEGPFPIEEHDQPLDELLLL